MSYTTLTTANPSFSSHQSFGHQRRHRRPGSFPPGALQRFLDVPAPPKITPHSWRSRHPERSIPAPKPPLPLRQIIPAKQFVPNPKGFRQDLRYMTRQQTDYPFSATNNYGLSGEYRTLASPKPKSTQRPWGTVHVPITDCNRQDLKKAIVAGAVSGALRGALLGGTAGSAIAGAGAAPGAASGYVGGALTGAALGAAGYSASCIL